jgi:hypothetical protein
LSARLERRLFLLLSAVCGAAWLCRADLGLDAATLEPSAPLTDLAPAMRERRFVDAIVRDPFDEPANEAVAGDVRPMPLPALDGVSVPNIDTTSSDEPRNELVVRAAIVGPAPVAYVEDGSGMQIVRVGDVVGGRNVSAIDLQGIAFTDGTRLDLPGAARDASGTPVPARPPARALTPPPAPVPSKTIAPKTASPSPAPDVAYPTPGPLPTADRRGLAPGVNPTPDAFGPTPFAYPYPYAPPH